MLIDAHSHIHFKEHFPDVDEVILRAEKTGVTGQVLIGCNVNDSRDVVDFVKLRRESYGNKNFWAVIGVHPHDSNQLTDEVLAGFEKMVDEENGGFAIGNGVTAIESGVLGRGVEARGKIIIGIGEIGLDYFRNFQSEDIQKNAFLEQLKLAKKLDLPVVIHERDAWIDTMEILKKAGNKKVVLHSFTGGPKQARECLERGYYISFSGMLTYPKNEHLREAACLASADRLMVETDCPYLPPQIYRGQRNEPAYVVETAKELARIKKTSFKEAADITTQNVKAFFRIDPV